MRRDAVELRRNLRSLAPTLSPDDIGLIAECLGYELLSRSIVEGRHLVDASVALLLSSHRRRAPAVTSGRVVDVLER